MKKYRKLTAFTLIELTVVIAVILFLSSIFLTNYRGGERQMALQRSAYKLAQDLRLAQERAIAGQSVPPNFDPAGGFPKGGYGLYLENGSNSYILFADCDGDKEYDPPGAGAASCAQAAPGNPFWKGEKVEEFSLEEKIKILNLSPFSPLDIVFFPVDPIIIINQTANLAVIALSFDGQTSRTVTINKIGLIDVD